LKLKISRFTLVFVYISLFVMTMMWASTGCGPGPTSYNIPDFYSPAFTKLTPEVFQSTSSVGLVYTVRIKVLDNSGNPKVSLMARKYGQSAFQQYAMTASEGFIFSATLPKEFISFDYYFSATDGINSTTYPTGAPTVFYSNLVGVPVIEANQYYGTEPALVLRPNSSVTFSADISSDTALEAGYPKLYIQDAGGANKTTQVMAATGEVVAGKQKYTLTLSGANFGSEKKYEYQIEVKNTASAAHDPYTVSYPSSTTFNKFEINASVNLPPVAILKYDAAKKYFVTTDVSGASDIDLDASTSYDPEDGKTGLVYKWTQISGPTVTTKDSGSHYYFTPSVVGQYSFSLQVTDKNLNVSNVAYTTPLIEVTNTVIPSDVVPADITTEIVISKSASPITIIGIITVKNGGRLRIERGVELKFETETGFVVENGGVINADGDATNKIIFKSTRAGSIKGQWNGIRIVNDQIYPSSSLNFCDISSAKTAVYVKDSKNPTISMCTITNNYDGIYSDNSTMTINQNIITDNGTDGVVCVNGSISTISSNNISKNKRYGIHCINSKSEITKNTVSENNYGIKVADSYKANSMVVNVYNNTIKSNTDGLRIENADPVIIANNISGNNDNGILCKNARAQFTSNNIYNNHDSGIQMIDCDYRKGSGALVNNSNISLYSCEIEIANNVISYSGADGIELEGSNPIINHNLIAFNSNAGVYIKSYKDTAGNNVIKDEASGLLMINNAFENNSRASISRNGPPPDQTGANDFANRSIMINNNNFLGITDYTDVATGDDVRGNNEIYFSSAFSDSDQTNGVVFSGKDYAGVLNTIVTLHRPAIAAGAITTYNDGRNIRAGVKSATDHTSQSSFESAQANAWLLNDIDGNPRRGVRGNNIVQDGTLGDVSLWISSGTAYSYYGANPNTDIGITRWVVVK